MACMNPQCKGETSEFTFFTIFNNGTIFCESCCTPVSFYPVGEITIDRTASDEEQKALLKPFLNKITEPSSNERYLIYTCYWWPDMLQSSSRSYAANSR
jgi:hypothetical protein